MVPTQVRRRGLGDRGLGTRDGVGSDRGTSLKGPGVLPCELPFL